MGGWGTGYNTVGMIGLIINLIRALCGMSQVTVVFGIGVLGKGMGSSRVNSRGLHQSIVVV